MLPIYLTRYGILSQNQPILDSEEQIIEKNQLLNALEGNKFIDTSVKI